MPSWPPTVPHAPERGSYAVTNLGLEPIQSEGQAGRVRMRPRATVDVAMMRWGRMLETAEVAALKAFLETDLGRATSRFDMPVWDATTRSYVTRNVSIVGGMSGIAWADKGGRTVVSMTLAVEGL